MPAARRFPPPWTIEEHNDVAEVECAPRHCGAVRGYELHGFVSEGEA
jgi:hypothetical protein